MFHYTYRTTNIITGDFYLGVRSSKKSPEKDPYLGSGVKIFNAIRKYGKTSFKKEVLETFPSRNDADDAEEVLIAQHLGKTDCYNIAPGGNGSARLGKKTPAEVYEKIAAKQRGVPKPKHTAEANARKSERMKGVGVVQTAEARRNAIEKTAAKARRAFADGTRIHHYLGKSRDEKVKEKIAKSLAGNIPWNKGVQATEEARQKMSIAKKDKHDRLEAKLRATGQTYDWLVTNTLLLHSQGNGPTKILQALGLRGIMTESPIKAIIRKHR